MIQRLLLVISILLHSLNGNAQAWQKMSPLVRQAAMEVKAPIVLRSPALRQRALRQGVITTIVKTQKESAAIFEKYGCQQLANFGSQLHIVAIPLAQLGRLSLEPSIERIEAGPRMSVLMDTTRIITQAIPANEGEALPQAFDGTGVVVGVMDIGFDLLHPNFYSRDMSRYRIRAMWDQLAVDTLNSQLYVGRDYVGEEELKAIGCPRDGYIQTHGTHTTGIAAGSGYDTEYRGIAPESDICLVCNATSDDAAIIDSTEYYKYTYATDALGFKYIFDYAQKAGKPCVINLSEGSFQDYHGYDQLYYALLDSLTGPGKIIVASAGNTGGQPRFIHKSADEGLAGAGFSNYDTNRAHLTLKGDGNYRFVATFTDNGSKKEMRIDVDSLLGTSDSIMNDSIMAGNLKYKIQAVAYPSCYIPSDRCLDVIITSSNSYFGGRDIVTFGAEGQTNVDLIAFNGYFYKGSNPLPGQILTDHSVNSPGSAPSVICAGANSYRTQFVNYLGETMNYPNGTNGELAYYSSKGPTFDNRLKPEVVAPGTNVISSYSSFYLESEGEKTDEKSFINKFQYDGRTFLWAANTGTSMSAPVVTGSVALWLQAKPDLTPDDVKDIIAHTSSHPDNTMTYPNNYYGYGQIDAYKGLLYILGTLGIRGISDHQPSTVSLRPIPQGARVTFSSPLSSPITVNVYTTAGCLVMTHRLAGDTDIELPRGLSIVQVNGPDAGSTGSFIIRR